MWKKRIAAENLEMFPSTLKRNCPEISLLISNHLDNLLINLNKHFSSIAVDQYDWVRSPFVGFEPSEGLFTLTEKLASVSTDRTLKLKHSELSLDTFWMLVERNILQLPRKRCDFCSFQSPTCVSLDFQL